MSSAGNDAIDMHDFRRAQHSIESIFVERWSPRAMSGESLSDATLNQLFEAARWAPSSYNNQPWRFLFARRESVHWANYLSLLVEFNQGWAQHAGMLAVLLSRRQFQSSEKPAPTHSLDAGAAWQNFALQGSRLGLVVHAMQGFDAERAAEMLKVPDVFKVEIIIAVGHPGPISVLDEGLQSREKPSDRKSIDALVREGEFSDDLDQV